MTDIPFAEQRVCGRLGELLRKHAVGDSLGDVTTERKLMSAFEWFLPELLHEVHEERHPDFLDGVYPKFFRKTADREAELLALANFISDMTLTPLYFRIQLSRDYGRVSWIDLRLGEHTANGCRREPYDRNEVSGPMLRVAERQTSIDWYYRVCYGERNS